MRGREGQEGCRAKRCLYTGARPVDGRGRGGGGREGRKGGWRWGTEQPHGRTRTNTDRHDRKRGRWFYLNLNLVERSNAEVRGQGKRTAVWRRAEVRIQRSGEASKGGKGAVRGRRGQEDEGQAQPYTRRKAEDGARQGREGRSAAWQHRRKGWGGRGTEQPRTKRTDTDGHRPQAGTKVFFCGFALEGFGAFLTSEF